MCIEIGILIVVISVDVVPRPHDLAHRRNGEPRTITPVWCEWEDKSPLTGTDEPVEEGGEEDEIEAGVVAKVVGGEGRK